MAKNIISEFILDRLAEGASFKDLQTEFNLTKPDFIKAALYGVAELREEYISLIAKRHHGH